MDITSPGLIERAIRKCLVGKWSRASVHDLLSQYCDYKPVEIAEIIRQRETNKLDGALKAIAVDLSKHIIARDLWLPPVHQFTAKDRSSGKEREYCEEAMTRQFCNYVAVEGLMPLFTAKIGVHQCASLVGRGQRYGQNVIEGWLAEDHKSARNAVQADVRKAYPSTDKNRLKRMLQRDVKNDALLWLVFLLLDGMPKGLSIGSYLSMFLCNYMLSYAWRAVKQRLFREEWKRGKNGVYERRRKPLISRALMYMDDLLLCGANKRDVLRGFWALCKFLRKKLGYHIKRSWRHFRTHFFDRAGKERGSFIDMMGVRLYQNRTTMRRRIFLRTRRVYAKMDRKTRTRKPISKRLAGRVVSYNGWLQHTDSRRWMQRHAYRHGIVRRAKRTIAYYAQKAREKHDTNRGIHATA